MKKLVLALASLALAAAPLVATAHGDEADATVETYYVDAETLGIYEESNGDAGLQTSAQDASEEHPNGVAADTKIA